MAGWRRRIVLAIAIVIASLCATSGSSSAVIVGSLEITSGPAVLNQPVTVIGFHPDCSPSYNWDFAAGEQMVAFSTNGSSTGAISITYAPEHLGTWTATARCRNYSELTVTFEVLATAPPPAPPPSPATEPGPDQAPATATPSSTDALAPPRGDLAALDGVFPRYVG